MVFKWKKKKNCRIWRIKGHEIVSWHHVFTVSLFLVTLYLTKIAFMRIESTRTSRSTMQGKPYEGKSCYGLTQNDTSKQTPLPFLDAFH